MINHDELQDLENKLQEQDKLMSQLYESTAYLRDHQYDIQETYEMRIQKTLYDTRMRLLIGNQVLFNRKILELLKIK